MRHGRIQTVVAVLLGALLLMSWVPFQRTAAQAVLDAAKPSGVVYAFWPNWIDPLVAGSKFKDYQPDWGALDYVSFFDLGLQSDGTLTLGNHEALFESVYRAAKKNNVKATITIGCPNDDVLATQKLQDSVLANHIDDLARNIRQELDNVAAAGFPLDGVCIDLENMNDTNQFTHTANKGLMEEFLKTLQSALNPSFPAKYHVAMCVQGALGSVYSNRNLAQYVDAAILMGYDYHCQSSPTTGPMSPLKGSNWTDNSIARSLTSMMTYYPKGKTILALPFYGWDFECDSSRQGAKVLLRKDQEGTVTSPKSLRVTDVLTQRDSGTLLNLTLHPSSESASSFFSPWYSYADTQGQWHQCWYEDDESLTQKITYAADQGLLGVGFWALGFEGGTKAKPATIWSVVRTAFPSSGNSSSSNTVLILDRSASMGNTWKGETKIDAAKKAATDFLTMVGQENSIGGKHNAGLVIFNEGPELLSTLGSDIAGMKALLDGIAPTGQTSVGDALNIALPQLKGTENPVVVLLTDGVTNTGPSRDEILTTIVQQFIDSGIKLYTVGFGEAGDLDEDFLKQLADKTGGQYFYADSAWNLESIFIKARHQSLGTMKGEFTGTVSQGETKAAGTLDVTEKNAELFVSLNWPGSTIDLILEDPQGRKVDAGYPGAQLFAVAKPAYVIINNPVSGTWKLSVFGRDVPQDTEAFDILASIRTSPIVPFNWTPVVLAVVIAALLAGAVVLVLLLTKGSTAIHTALYYVLVTSGNAQRAIPVRKTTVHVGRAQGNDIILPDPLVSNRHCDIMLEQQSWIVRDLGSTNGTFVDGKKISAARVSPDNSIRIGTSILRLASTLPIAGKNKQPVK